jgi:hypothetical protein
MSNGHKNTEQVERLIVPDSPEELELLEALHEAHDDILKVTDFAIRLSHIERVPIYPTREDRSGTAPPASTIERGENYDRHENDLEHSGHLQLMVMALVPKYSRFLPDLDLTKLLQYPALHDLIETATCKSGCDINTLGVSKRDLKRKEAAERAALPGLIAHLSPDMGQILQDYHDQVDRESRFVRYVDKLSPVAVRLMKGSDDPLSMQYTPDQLFAFTSKKADEMTEGYPEFPFLDKLFRLLILSSTEHVYKSRPAETIPIKDARRRLGKKAVVGTKK